MYTYDTTERAADPRALPNIEVFCVDERTAQLGADTGNELNQPGWYYWPCFPGCLPDGPAVGPFETEREALEACQVEYDNV